MEASLRGYALAVLENAVADPASQGGGDGDEVARDLRQVSDLIATTPPLSQVLTEGTVPVGARHAVVDDLLTTRIVPRALRIVSRRPRVTSRLGQVKDDRYRNHDPRTGS